MVILLKVLEQIWESFTYHVFETRIDIDLQLFDKKTSSPNQEVNIAQFAD